MNAIARRVRPRAWPACAARGPLGRVRLYASEAKLDLVALDKKWKAKWAETQTPTPTTAKKYILPMFPYPSGNLHLGHLRVYTIADVLARYHRLQGAEVLLPMGWDAFGLPAENAALERGIRPATWTRDNIGRMKAQLEVMSGSWDWSRELATCEPAFYRHTQHIFLQLHAMGLAYQAEAEVNYDPADRTVLANEQVDAQGRSWRSGARVEKRRLKQWFLRISAFREALLQDLDVLARDDAWPERVLAMQRHWLGRSAGAVVQFPLLALGQLTTPPKALEVFTTRIDTLLGVQYLALAASHPVVRDLAQADPALQAFLDTLPGLPPDAKVGYLLPHLRAINPLAYHDATPAAAKASLPIYVAPYVLGDYGEGAVMGVPGHDARDHAFWQVHGRGEPVRLVVAPSEDESTAVLDEPYVGHGVMTAHSGPFAGRTSHDAAAMLLAMLEAAQLARPTERWRLRDWLVSRQRYWGTPIPIIHCDGCGAVPVPAADLPVTLPDVDAHFAEKRAGNPLEAADDWLHVACPQCGQPARRDTDTMDTFVDSSWYYLRFADPDNADAPFSPAAVRASLPVDIYVGGIEHAILHLLYARFVYKALMQSPLMDAKADGVAEPFARLITQGMVHGKTFTDPTTGRFLKPDEVDLRDPAAPRVVATGQLAAVSFEKMSKSKHNGVDPTTFIARHGADATRAHMLFQAPVGDVLLWDADKIAGVTRWMGRLYDMVQKAGETEEADETAVVDDLRRRTDTPPVDPAALARWDADAAVWRAVQTAIASVTAAYAKVYALNTVVSDLMRLTNAFADHEPTASPAVLRAALAALVRMLAPIAPALAEECWSRLCPAAPSLFAGPAHRVFPAPDGSLAWLQPRRQRCAVQLNGKLRCTVDIPRPPPALAGDALRDWLVRALLDTDEGRARLAGGSRDITQAKKAIVVRDGQLVNFVF